jgi:hypothetical protein
MNLSLVLCSGWETNVERKAVTAKSQKSNLTVVVESGQKYWVDRDTKILRLLSELSQKKQ